MIDPPRTLLPPPHASGTAAHRTGLVATGQARSASAGLPVPMIVPVPPAPPQDGRDETSLSDGRRGRQVEIDDGTGARAGAGRQIRIAYADWRERTRETGPLSSTTGAAAFMAQQIFQEAMSTGLHLEPWSLGIGAYRRAGAEPPLDSAGPALLSLAV